MKSRWITLALCLLVAVILIVRLLPRGGRHAAGDTSTSSQAAPANAYMGLRSLVLDATRDNFGLSPGASRSEFRAYR